MRLGGFVHGDVEAVGWQPVSRALRPLDEYGAFGERIVQAKLIEV